MTFKTVSDPNLCTKNYDGIIKENPSITNSNIGYNEFITFRFDDVCINADMDLIHEMTNFILDTRLERAKKYRVIWGVSPLVHDMTRFEGKVAQRVFPSIFNAMSDYRQFFHVDLAGTPPIHPSVEIASHGLIHVDHRLLTKSQQEMSILISCSLTKSSTFIPPFNKYNADTQDICREHKIKLIKFEDGWLSMEHNKFHQNHDKWYLHAREFTIESFKEWFNASNNAKV